MNIFRLTPEGLAAMRKRIMIRVIPVFLVVVIVLAFVASKNKNDVMLMAGFVIVVGAWSVFNISRRLKKVYESYEIEVDEHAVIRRQAGAPDLNLSVFDIKLINQKKTGGIIIRGEGKGETIIIPPEIERLDELTTLLNQMVPFSEKDIQPVAERFGAVFGLFSLALLLGFVLIDNKILSSICGAALAAIMIRAFVLRSKNTNLPDSVRRSGWILLLVGAVILVNIVIRWMGYW
ncbi:hypothetical protein [Chitinophaga vietnamensis]|uniref:hypothetical protein n=1 Tax=Chitinophaga vietnamensis TaxID=2593957 RepID=UPI001177D68C|nr:hypothetical protein [Chitinophaga vietnamensis]